MNNFSHIVACIHISESCLLMNRCFPFDEINLSFLVIIDAFYCIFIKAFALLNYRYILLPLENTRISAFAYSSMMHCTYLFTFVLVYEPLHTCNHHDLCMEASGSLWELVLSTSWIPGIKARPFVLASDALAR